jgi:HD-GYP domain-containing protein (c-di-GMP phosphodiesterase class II)
MVGTAVDVELQYRRLIELGVNLSAERDHDHLIEMILVGAKDLASADGGTLYLVSEDRSQLTFAIMRNDSLGIAVGGTTGAAISASPVPLTDAKGQPNHNNVAAFVAVTGQTINIADVYDEPGFDFSGTRAYDAHTGYRSQSFLTLALKNHEGDVVGVLQLINARMADGRIGPFAPALEPVVTALASQAAVALDNQLLVEAQRNLFRSFLKVFANALDIKSAYTGGHCRRVPELTTMLARAAGAAADGPFAGFQLRADEWYELEVASGLHDCGKVTTREFIVDKATKLETVYNRIHEIRTRFEVVKRDAEIDYLKAVAAGGDEPSLRAARDTRLAALDDDFAFVAQCNVGGEFMADDKIARLRQIGAVTWLRTIDDGIGLSWAEASRAGQSAELPVVESLLADKPGHLVPHDTPPLAPDDPLGFTVKPPDYALNLGELYNLSIRRGTLTGEERYHINDHIVQTIKMLEDLPFPKNLRRVPEWAGGHHEKMDGTGYPRGLTREQMSVPARIMAIADIFEALTARDRPYKSRKTLSQSLSIMKHMSEEERHIDPDLFALLLTSGVYQDYADAFLLPDQIDDVDVARYLPKVSA